MAWQMWQWGERNLRHGGCDTAAGCLVAGTPCNPATDAALCCDGGCGFDSNLNYVACKYSLVHGVFLRPDGHPHLQNVLIGRLSLTVLKCMEWDTVWHSGVACDTSTGCHLLNISSSLLDCSPVCHINDAGLTANMLPGTTSGGLSAA